MVQEFHPHNSLYSNFLSPKANKNYFYLKITFLRVQVFPASWICRQHWLWAATKTLRLDCCPSLPKAAVWGWGWLQHFRRQRTWKCRRCRSDPPPKKLTSLALQVIDFEWLNTLRRISSSSSSEPIELLQLERACCSETGDDPAISAASPITAISFVFIVTAANYNKN